MKKTLEHIVTLINALKYDIRAEVIVNNLLENKEIHNEQFVVQREGQFARAYRFDVLSSEITDYDDATQFLKLNLSRDSIYDMLPEGITHQSINDESQKGVNTMIKEYNIRKKQQKVIA